MLSWREIGKGETELLTEAAQWERAFPTWYRDASNTWTATEAEVLKFYEHCEKLFGIFEEDEMTGLIYLEKIGENELNAHFDMKRGSKTDSLILARVRDHIFNSGFRDIQTWVLKRNKMIQKLIIDTGFDMTGLTMRCGHSHGKVLEWLQLRMTTSF